MPGGEETAFSQSMRVLTRTESTEGWAGSSAVEAGKQNATPHPPLDLETGGEALGSTGQIEIWVLSMLSL